MSGNRFTLIPSSRPVGMLFLIAGLLVILSTGYQLASHGAAVLPVVALVLGITVLVLAVIGLMSPRLRGH